MTLQTTKSIPSEFGTTLMLDIIESGETVGSAMLTLYHGENVVREYAHLERIDIDEDKRGLGYGSAAIEAMRKEHGRIVAAPDSEDSQRLYERLGELVVDHRGDMEEIYLCVGFGVYEIC